MSKIKIVTVVGARPQFIKASAISNAIRNTFADAITEVIVHTGQHYDSKLSDIFFKELNIPKEDYNLHVGSGTHAAQTAKMLTALEEVYEKELPQLVLVYGDTNSTLAAALVASKMHIPVAHVEAGLRSFNKHMPEELNRIATDHFSTLLFCPTQTAVNNLKHEGFSNTNKKPGINNPAVFLSGDVMFDVNLLIKPMLHATVKNEEQKYALLTLHRAENTDNPEVLSQLVEAILQVLEMGIKIWFPVHPRTKAAMQENLPLTLANQFLQHKNISILEPLGFLEMMQAIHDAEFVLTDSGGVQKEAYFFQKPLLILREQTEWVELVNHGAAVLCGHDKEKICHGVEQINNFRSKKFPYFYGEGNAAHIILKEILNTF
ncbi:MAG: non-hydrolyzing UDP-N-acetylglucosamine 2-epimerase [Luteibaculaceae bacterium]